MPRKPYLRAFSALTFGKKLIVGWAILVFFLAITGVAWNVSRKNAAAALQQKFDNQCQKIESMIQLRLLTYVGTLDAAGGLFSALPTVGRKEWTAFFKNRYLNDTSPGLQEVAYLERVPRDRKAALTARIRGEGYPNFAVQPAGDRDEYYPVVYIHPLDVGNMPVFGFDILTEPVRKESLLRSRDSGRMTLSDKVTLLINAPDRARPGFILFRPLYKAGMPTVTVQQRRQAIFGFLIAALRMNDLFYQSEELTSDVYFKVFAGNPQILVFDSHPEGTNKDTAEPAIITRKAVDIVGQPWTFEFRTSPSFAAELNADYSDKILFAGILLALLSFLAACFVINAKEQALNLAEEMTLRVREANAFLEHILENIPVMTFIKDAKELRFVRVNKALEETVGLPQTELLGKQDHDFFPKEEADFFVAKDREVLEGRKLVNIEKEPIQTAHRGQRFLHTKKIPIVDANGNPTHLLGVSEDITDQLKSEHDLRVAKELAEAATVAKDKFLANMSHELRTPLSAILNYSALIEEDAENRGLYDTVKDVRNLEVAARHLLELINNILDLSKIEAGKVEVHLEEANIFTIVHNVVSMTGSFGSKAKNNFYYTCSEDIGTMKTDATKVRQALSNLLNNAFKFTKNGTIHLKAERKQEATGDWVVFTISDTGIGMSEAQMKNLFKDFSQVFDSTKESFEGTGLGLSLSRRLCRILGGDITVTSELGRGSTFTVRLPANPVNLAEKKFDVEAPTPIVPVPLPEGIKGGEILVIEDDRRTQEIIRHYLEKTGFRVCSAYSGDEGLRLARAIHPAAITLDVMMPVMDGWAVLRELKKDPALSDIPVVLMTLVNDKQTAMSFGIRDYLTKPINFNSLIGILNRFRVESDRPVMVVDDDESSRRRLTGILKEQGYQSVQASDGTEALALLEKKHPSLIFLDLMMPKMNGFEFIAKLKENTMWQKIPVVVLTSKDLTDEDRRLLNGRVESLYQKQGGDIEAFVQSVMKVASSNSQKRVS